MMAGATAPRDPAPATNRADNVFNAAKNLLDGLPRPRAAGRFLTSSVVGSRRHSSYRVHRLVGGLSQRVVLTNPDQLAVFVIVNVPLPAQPAPPVRDHVPVIDVQVVFPDESVVPVAVPVIDSVLPPDCTMN